MPRVLITGASGFVGGWLAREWHDSGAEVLGISRRAESPAGAAKAVDLLDAAAVEAAVREFQPDFVCHLAALASTGRSWQQPSRCVGDNQAMTWNLLEAVRQHAGTATVLVAGSGEGYGVPQQLPVSELHRLAPGTPYAIAKAATDLIGGLYADAHGLNVVRARAFNHAGPGQGGSFLVGSICSQAAEQLAANPGSQITVRTGAAEVRRDYCDVRDVARAYRLLCEAGEPGIWNVCSGSSTSTSEVVALLEEAVAPAQLVHQVDPAIVRPHETLDICGDPAKLAAATGWKPLIPLSQTVADTLASARAG
jgi:GDP-4-dehydro-6-deoxy-D-mannose reductase